MKNIFTHLLIFTVLISCKNQTAENSNQVDSVIENIPAFNDEIKDTSIKNISVRNTDDTISYALGVAWSNGIAKVGLNKVSPSFYIGAHDFMVRNKTFTDAKESGERLDKEIAYLKNDSEHVFDPNQKLGDIKLASKFDTLSYQLAYAWTRGAKEYGIDRLTPALLLGLMAGMQSDTSLFSYPKADKYLRGQIETKRGILFAESRLTNEKWLTDNSSKEGVITLKSGLQYKVIKAGKGKSPKADEVITCDYIGKLIDKTEFENTYKAGSPLKALPYGVIPAWREALPLMKVGSKWELYVPYKLGYGSGGVKNKVPPFATLIYELELLSVEPMK